MRVATGAIVVGMVVVATLGCTSDADSTTSAPHADATATTTTTAATSTTSTSTTATSSTTIDSPNPGLGEPPARLATPPDAAGIAMRLSTAHATMVDVAAPGEQRAAAGIDHQLVLRALADRPELDDAVLRALDPESRPTVERTIRARQFLQQRNATRPPQPLPDELPAWTIVEPEPIDTLLARYAEAERLTGIPWYWLAAIHLQETRMGRVQGTSTADAVGPMQFLPSTWAACCTGDPTVTRDAIIGAATYLAQSGGPADMAAAVYQYNPNDGYVSVVTAYAENLRDLPELYAGYHAFQVFFATSAGTVRLPVGYSTSTPITVSEYLDAHPQDAA